MQGRKSMLRCPRCHNVTAYTVDSSWTERKNAERRRRKCKQCGFRFTTYERVYLSKKDIAENAKIEIWR